MSATAIELFHQDGRPAGIWYCSECRVVHASVENALACHGPCGCGNPAKSRYSAQCHECAGKAWREKCQREEAERYEKAEKVSEVAHKGPIFADGCGQEFFQSVEDLLDHLDGDEPPPYVWTCRDIGIRKASSEHLLDVILDGMWDDADATDLKGIEDLEAAIAAFNEANEAATAVYRPDYTTAVVLLEAAPAALSDPSTAAAREANQKGKP